ncbi:MAG: hypothetical protein IJP61_03060 [Treponema sp.]|nr:hypothetical protein [Treponema sp.]
MTSLNFALAYSLQRFEKPKTKEEQDSFLKKYFLRFDESDSSVISSMNTFSEEFKKSVLSKEEVQFINSYFLSLCKNFIGFICMFDDNKDHFSEEVREKLGFYYDKMKLFFNELWKMVDEHNAKNPDKKLMTVSEAIENYVKPINSSFDD